VEYFYGATGQLVGVEQQNGSIFVADVDYDIFGRAEKIVHGNGISDMASFYDDDESFRLDTLQVAGGSQGTHLNLKYSYNALGKVEHVQDFRDTTLPLSNTADFTYDELGRLTQATGASYSQGYSYDSFGNITQAGAGALLYSPTKPHQVTLRGLSFPVQHDANGNLSLKQTTSGAITNSYDALDRLVTSTVLPGGTQTHKYDYSGRRVWRSDTASGVTERYFNKLVEFDGTVVTKYYYAGKRLIAARWVPDSTFGTHAPPAAPLRIPPELPVALGVLALLLLAGFGRRDRRVGIAIGPSRAAGAAILVLAAAPPIGLFSATAAYADCDPDLNILHYHFDHLGSTQVITDYQGAIYQQIRYTAYGQIRGRWDASGGAIGPDPAGLTREFTGYESDALTGFQYAGARYFDPELGQFLSHDPAGQFASPYAYGPGDPMNGIDPDGQIWWFGAILFAAWSSFCFSFSEAMNAEGHFNFDVLKHTLTQMAIAVATAAVLGPIAEAVSTTGQMGANIAFSVRAASVGYGAYQTQQAAQSGNVPGAVMSGMNTLMAAYSLAAGSITSGGTEPSETETQFADARNVAADGRTSPEELVVHGHKPHEGAWEKLGFFGRHIGRVLDGMKDQAIGLLLMFGGAVHGLVTLGFTPVYYTLEYMAGSSGLYLGILKLSPDLMKLGVGYYAAGWQRMVSGATGGWVPLPAEPESPFDRGHK
jgi:RHS repeat-associated protein